MLPLLYRLKIASNICSALCESCLTCNCDHENSQLLLERVRELHAKIIEMTDTFKIPRLFL